MAQTRNFKIGTVYSRLRSLLEKKAMNEEAKPVWYDIYEAFPPKYEPRFDRHLLSYGAGSNVAKSAPTPKILYKEDKIRAQYYTAFMPNIGKQHSTYVNSRFKKDLTNRFRMFLSSNKHNFELGLDFFKLYFYLHRYSIL